MLDNEKFYKHSPVRKLVAERLRYCRRIEVASSFNVEQIGNGYLFSLLGLRYFFDYLRQLSESKLILDIGAGTTRAVYELSQSKIGEGFDFFATGLYVHTVSPKFLGRERFRATSAEVLRGFQDRSVAGMLAVRSIGYSSYPEMVARRVDEVLIPGGAFKGVFKGPKGVSAFGLSTPLGFSEVLESLDYDCASFDNGHIAVLLAIKPGVDTTQSAKSLLKSDLNDDPKRLGRFMYGLRDGNKKSS